MIKKLNTITKCFPIYAYEQTEKPTNREIMNKHRNQQKLIMVHACKTQKTHICSSFLFYSRAHIE